MVARHRKDWCQIMFIGQVELVKVPAGFPEKVHAVPQAIKEGRIILGMCSIMVKIPLHVIGDDVLRNGIYHAPHIPSNMKNKFLVVRYRLHGGVIEYLSKIEVKGCWSGRGR